MPIVDILSDKKVKSVEDTIHKGIIDKYKENRVALYVSVNKDQIESKRCASCHVDLSHMGTCLHMGSCASCATSQGLAKIESSVQLCNLITTESETDITLCVGLVCENNISIPEISKSNVEFKYNSKSEKMVKMPKKDVYSIYPFIKIRITGFQKCCGVVTMPEIYYQPGVIKRSQAVEVFKLIINDIIVYYLEYNVILTTVVDSILKKLLKDIGFENMLKFENQKTNNDVSIMCLASSIVD